MIFSRFSTEDAKAQALAHGLEVSEDPEAIVCLGGDGTFLLAEQRYPGVPKIIVRRESVCGRCATDDIDAAFAALAKKEYRIARIEKLRVEGLPLAINDIIVRNTHPNQALRFALSIDGEPIGSFIGDGIVAATSFGSSAYYEAIVGEGFEEGSRVALNNVKDSRESLPFSTIELTIERGEAMLASDANPPIPAPQRIRIERAGEHAQVIWLDPAPAPDN